MQNFNVISTPLPPTSKKNTQKNFHALNVVLKRYPMSHQTKTSEMIAWILHNSAFCLPHLLARLNQAYILISLSAHL